MNFDKTHWLSLQPPSAPWDEDVEVYRRLMVPGRVLLLGCTEKLLPLADQALDLQPLYADAKIRQGDWLENSDFFENIIGDGVFHLDARMSVDLLEMAKRCSQTLICRSFTKRLEGMRYAQHFPRPEDFRIKPDLVIPGDIYSFYKWSFR